jgi:hypothetical protein
VVIRMESLVFGPRHSERDESGAAPRHFVAAAGYSTDPMS